MRSSVTSLSFGQFFAISLALFALLLVASKLLAWTGPTATPPNSNVAAPINVGSVDQSKSANLGVNGLAVFGNTLFGGVAGSNAYTNFGATSGTNGYGFRDNGGVMQYKNSGGVWAPIAAGGSGSFDSATWHNVSDARASGVGYSNSANHPMEVTLTPTTDFGAPCDLYVLIADALGNQFAIGSASYAASCTLTFMVPAHGAYILHSSGLPSYYTVLEFY